MAPGWALRLSSGTDLESWTVVDAQSWTLLESAQFGYPEQGYWPCLGDECRDTELAFLHVFSVSSYSLRQILEPAACFP